MTQVQGCVGTHRRSKLRKKTEKNIFCQKLFQQSCHFNISLRFPLTHVFPLKVPSTIHYLQKEEFVYRNVFRIRTL